MNGLRRAGVVAAALAAGLAWSEPAALAGLKQGQSLLDLGMGVGIPLSGLDLARFGGGSERPGAAGLTIGPRYLYQARTHLGLGAELSYSSFPDRSVPLGRGLGTAGGSAFSAEGVARYLFDPEAKVSPYAIAGLGLVNFAAVVREGDGDILLDSSSVGLSMSAGGGVEADLSPNMVASGEARWRLGTIDSALFGTSLYNALALTARVGFKF